MFKEIRIENVENVHQQQFNGCASYIYDKGYGKYFDFKLY